MTGRSLVRSLRDEVVARRNGGTYAVPMPPRRARTKVIADPSSPHESRPRSARAATAGAVLLIAALVLTACTGSEPDGGDFGDGDFADDGCTNVVIATSSEKVNMLDELAAAFKESPRHDALDECATVHPINVSSGEATRILTAGGDWPDEDTRRWPTMWSPASTVWTDRVAAAGSPSLVGEPESFTLSLIHI